MRGTVGRWCVVCGVWCVVCGVWCVVTLLLALVMPIACYVGRTSTGDSSVDERGKSAAREESRERWGGAGVHQNVSVEAV